jgi:hypothetical protein
MTGGSGAKDVPHTLNDEERARGKDVLSGLGELERRALLTWVGENLPYVQRTAVGQRPVYWILGIGFVVGLAAYVGGYALRSSVTTEPLGFVGDTLYTLGWAIWTGVVVVIFLQVLPEASGVNTSSCSMPTRQPCAKRMEPKATRLRTGREGNRLPERPMDQTTLR